MIPAPTHPLKPAENQEKIAPPLPQPSAQPKESGGPKGAEPTRFGDWEINGKCVDF